MNVALLLAASCVLSASAPAPSCLEHRIAETLDALEEAEMDSAPLASHSSFLSSRAYADFTNYGPNVIPVLLARIDSSQDARRIGMWHALLGLATRMQAFPYSTSPRVINGIDWHEPELDRLPPVSFRLDEAASSYADTSSLFELWQKRETLPQSTIRLAVFLSEERLLKPSASDLVGEDFRRFFRLTCNCGILDLPVHIHLIGIENSILALHAFFTCSGLRRDLVEYPPNFLDQVRQTEGLYPSHADRVSAVRTWWAEARPTYSLLPDLQGEIDAAVAALPEPES